MKSPIVQRIQKLLSLATSANEHEAKAAAEQAARLLIKHNLKRQDITERREYENREGLRVEKVPPEHKFSQAIVRTHFFVEVVSTRRVHADTTIHFIGEPENVAVAMYVYEFLLREFRVCWAAYRKETGAAAKAKQAYYFGLYSGLKEQLSAASRAVETEMGLVVVRDPGLMMAVRKGFGATSQSTNRVPIADRSAVAAGHEHGKSMQIRKGLTSSSTNTTAKLGAGK